VREHVDLPTVDALDEQWRLHPPVHHLVAAYMDYKPRDARATAADADVTPLLAELGEVPIRHVMPIDTSAFDELMAHKGQHDG
jgi:hypothetical protein